MSKGARVPVVLEQASLRALSSARRCTAPRSRKVARCFGHSGHVGKVLTRNSWVVEAHGDGKLEAVTIRSGAEPCGSLAIILPAVSTPSPTRNGRRSLGAASTTISVRDG